VPDTAWILIPQKIEEFFLLNDSLTIKIWISNTKVLLKTRKKVIKKSSLLNFLLIQHYHKTNDILKW